MESLKIKLESCGVHCLVSRGISDGAYNCVCNSVVGSILVPIVINLRHPIEDLLSLNLEREEENE